MQDRNFALRLHKTSLNGVRGKFAQVLIGKLELPLRQVILVLQIALEHGRIVGI